MKIKLAKLQEGINQLHFETNFDKLGVEDQEQLSIFPEKVILDVEVQKLSDQYFVRTDIRTTAHFACDRCLESYTKNTAVSYQLYYSKIEDHESENDDYRFLDQNAVEIDLRDSIIENLLLTIPMKKLCDLDCLGLCPECGTNLNFEQCDCEQEHIDPRWEKLKKLIN